MARREARVKGSRVGCAGAQCMQLCSWSCMLHSCGALQVAFTSFCLYCVSCFSLFRALTYPNPTSSHASHCLTSSSAGAARDIASTDHDSRPLRSLHACSRPAYLRPARDSRRVDRQLNTRTPHESPRHIMVRSGLLAHSASLLTMHLRLLITLTQNSTMCDRTGSVSDDSTSDLTSHRQG